MVKEQMKRSMKPPHEQLTQYERFTAEARESDQMIREEAAAMDAEGNKRAAGDRAQAELHRSQSEKFIDMARELGLDAREETFDAALTKVARHRTDASGAADGADEKPQNGKIGI